MVQRAQWRGTPGAALIKHHDAIVPRVKEAAMRRGRARARPAVQKHHRLALGVTTDLPIHLMPVTDRQHACVVRFDIGVKLGAQGRGVIGHGVFGAEKSKA